MQAIELRAALIAANDINLNGADALVETSILKQLIASCEARVDELEKEAKEMALTHTRSGQFTHEGHTYELQENVTFDFVGKPQKYTMPEGEPQIAIFGHHQGTQSHQRCVHDYAPQHRTGRSNVRPQVHRIKKKGSSPYYPLYKKEKMMMKLYYADSTIIK